MLFPIFLCIAIASSTSKRDISLGVDVFDAPGNYIASHCLGSGTTLVTPSGSSL
uniref:Secreted protein n=1 Tax=Phakopsora pachyrhizi TaxID=170000 RepID=A0A0S1MJI3_PHAPC